MDNKKVFVKLQEDITTHYSSGYEETRLTSSRGQVELERTHELLKRFLPPPPAKILDIGGGTGIHACWLAKQGYEVHLVDIVPLHVQLALKASENQPEAPITSATIGDARSLNHENEFFDATLLFGPLYHLVEKEDRNIALQEAYRVLKNNGILLAVGISRFASLLDGIRGGYLNDPDFIKIVKQDLLNGQHRNPTEKREYFMDTFFHLPEELKEEINKVGFTNINVLGIEGPCWISEKFGAFLENIENRKMMLSIVKQIEADQAIIGASAHLMAIGNKKIK